MWENQGSEGVSDQNQVKGTNKGASWKSSWVYLYPEPGIFYYNLFLYGEPLAFLHGWQAHN